MFGCIEQVTVDSSSLKTCQHRWFHRLVREKVCVYTDLPFFLPAPCIDVAQILSNVCSTYAQVRTMPTEEDGFSDVRIKMRKMHTCFAGIMEDCNIRTAFFDATVHKSHGTWKSLRMKRKISVLTSSFAFQEALTISLHLHFQGSCCGLWPTSAPMMRMVWKGAGEVGRCWKVPSSPAGSFSWPGVSEAAAMVPGGQEMGEGYCMLLLSSR